jgi:hypothetical protein
MSPRIEPGPASFEAVSGDFGAAPYANGEPEAFFGQCTNHLFALFAPDRKTTMPLDASSRSILEAVLALGGLSLVMAAWQGLTRLPAMKAAGLGLQDAAHTADLDKVLPSSVRRVNDNYNHLMEAPTVFYAVTLAIVALGIADAVDARCAWVYVGLRALHSLVQATVNVVSLRAGLYIASWIALAVLIVRPLMSVLTTS